MNPTVEMAANFDKNQLKILLSDIIIVNISPYHKLPPDGGTIFELVGYLCVAFFSPDRDVLRDGMPRSRGWLVEQRRYDAKEYEKQLREIAGSTPYYVHGTFLDAVRFVKNKLK